MFLNVTRDGDFEIWNDERSHCFLISALNYFQIWTKSVYFSLHRFKINGKTKISIVLETYINKLSYKKYRFNIGSFMFMYENNLINYR